MKYQIFLSAFFLLITGTSARAEYRAFLLKISKKTSDPAMAQDYRLVTSTLDHLQYHEYYPVAADEEVTYIATWRCPGRTDNFKPICDNPKGQIPPEGAPAP